jgi:hypothetical protein
MNIITYIPWFHVTDKCIGEITWQYVTATWLLYSSVNLRIYWPCGIYICRLTEKGWPRGLGADLQPTIGGTDGRGRRQA